jgi:hypothetical protein
MAFGPRSTPLLQRFAVKLNCDIALVQEIFSEEKHALPVGVAEEHCIPL